MKERIEQLLARYLRRKGWVVFYLEDEDRECRAVCWMQEYANAVKRADEECIAWRR